MEELLGYVIRGIPFGCVFGLVAVGLVLTYKTSGVFNLAFAAQAFLSAAVFYDLRKDAGVGHPAGVRRVGRRGGTAGRTGPRAVPVPLPAHGSDGRQARDCAGPAGRRPRDREALVRRGT